MFRHQTYIVIILELSAHTYKRTYMSVYVYVFPGTSIHPEAMMHPPCFRCSPYFPKMFRLCEKFSKFYPFSRNFFPFSSAKISDDLFLVIEFFPYFPCDSVHFPLFRKIIILLPAFINFPSVFQKFTCFLHTFCVFRFPPTLTMMHLCRAGLTIVPFVPWHGAPRRRGPPRPAHNFCCIIKVG